MSEDPAPYNEKKAIEAGKEPLTDLLKRSVLERLASPFFGGFIVAFLVHNWEQVSLFLFDDESMFARVSFLKSQYSSNWFWHYYLYPSLVALIYVFAWPFPRKWFDDYLRWRSLEEDKGRFENEDQRRRLIKKARNLGEWTQLETEELEISEREQDLKKRKADVEAQISDIEEVEGHLLNWDEYQADRRNEVQSSMVADSDKEEAEPNEDEIRQMAIDQDEALAKRAKEIMDEGSNRDTEKIRQVAVDHDLQGGDSSSPVLLDEEPDPTKDEISQEAIDHDEAISKYKEERESDPEETNLQHLLIDDTVKTKKKVEHLLDAGIKMFEIEKLAESNTKLIHAADLASRGMPRDWVLWAFYNLDNMMFLWGLVEKGLTCHEVTWLHKRGQDVSKINNAMKQVGGSPDLIRKTFKIPPSIIGAPYRGIEDWSIDEA